MNQFHSDEYVDFLSRITHNNMNSYIKEQHKCMSCSSPSPQNRGSWRSGLTEFDYQIMLVMIVPYLTACLSIVRYLLEVRWVCQVTSRKSVNFGDLSLSVSSFLFLF